MNLSKSAAFKPNRGTILIVVLLLSAIIGISLASYLQLANNSLKQATRSFYSNSGMNLAEMGLEQAIARFNQLDDVTTASDAWPSAVWTLDSTPYNAMTSPFTPSARASFNSFALGPGATGSVKVYVHYWDGLGAAKPTVVAKSIINEPNGNTISKYIEVDLRKRSLFDNGLVARNDVTWSGTPMAASWNSDPDNNPGTPAINYSAGEMKANVTVGSISGNIGLSNGQVYGFAKTGPTGTISGGSVHGLGTTTDDATRRTNDFNATFPNPTTPSPTIVNPITSSITSDITLPRTSGPIIDTAQIVNGVETFYYVFSSSAVINLGGGDNFNISANKNIVMIMNNHTGVMVFQNAGTGELRVGSGATLNVYTNGNVAIAGNGLVNDNAQPKNVMFWGTRTTDGQTITISGNGQLKAVVYAPNATVSMNGGGTSGKVMGSIVAKVINMTGGSEFYYDESLANLTTGNPYGISKWKELQTASERNVYESQLN